MFLGTMFFLETVKTEEPSLLENAEGLPNASIGLMNVDQQRSFKVTLCHWETSVGPLTVPTMKFGSIILHQHWRTSSTEQLKI